MDTPGSDTPHPHLQNTRETAGRVWRARASRLAGIWLVVALAEYVAWWLFLSKAFYRAVFMPIAVAILVAGVAASWRTLMRREPDRRAGDRRAQERRELPLQPD